MIVRGREHIHLAGRKALSGPAPHSAWSHIFEDGAQRILSKARFLFLKQAAKQSIDFCVCLILLKPHKPLSLPWKKKEKENPNNTEQRMDPELRYKKRNKAKIPLIRELMGPSAVEVHDQSLLGVGGPQAAKRLQLPGRVLPLGCKSFWCLGIILVAEP